MVRALHQMVRLSEGDGEGPPGSGCVQRAYHMLYSRFDSVHGGFGSSPKFPQPGQYIKYIHTFTVFHKVGSQCSARCCVALHYVAVTFGCVAMRCGCSFTMLASRCTKCVASYNYRCLVMWCLRGENPVCQLASCDRRR